LLTNVKVLSVARSIGLAIAVVSLPACEKGTVDAPDVEQGVRQDILAQVGVETDVDCPKNVELVAGTTFVCEARDEGGTIVPVEAEVLTDEGQVRWHLGLYNIEDLEQEVGDVAGDQLDTAVRADCPSQLLREGQAERIVCMVETNEGRSRRAPVRITADGEVIVDV
jgi:hypothetical protein